MPPSVSSVRKSSWLEICPFMVQKSHAGRWQRSHEGTGWIGDWQKWSWKQSFPDGGNFPSPSSLFRGIISPKSLLITFDQLPSSRSLSWTMSVLNYSVISCSLENSADFRMSSRPDRPQPPGAKNIHTIRHVKQNWRPPR